MSLLNPNDEVLKALVIIGARRPGHTHTNVLNRPDDGLVALLHRADADGVFDQGDAWKMAGTFIQEYL